jgi:hypothetical protein
LLSTFNTTSPMQVSIPVTQTITDSIFISFSPTWNRAVCNTISDSNHHFNRHRCTTVSHTVTLSTPLSQNPKPILHLHSERCQRNSFMKGSGESNNIIRSDQFVLLSYPEIDLKIISYWKYSGLVLIRDRH